MSRSSSDSVISIGGRSLTCGDVDVETEGDLRLSGFAAVAVEDEEDDEAAGLLVSGKLGKK